MSSFRLDRARLTQGMFAPLKTVDYRRLLTSNGLWWGIIFMESTALGWLVLDLTDSAWMVALVADPIDKLQTGYLAERWGAPTTIATQALAAVVSIAVIVLLLPGLRTPVAAPAAAPPVATSTPTNQPTNQLTNQLTS